MSMQDLILRTEARSCLTHMKNGHKSTASTKLSGYPISKCKQVSEHLHRLESNTSATPSQQSFLVSADTASALPPHVS